MHIARWLFVLILAVSNAAAAQPVRVTSQLSGELLFKNPIVLQHIGHGDFFSFTGDAMPFDLTLSALIDPEAISTSSDASRVYAYDAEAAVTLAMGGTTSRFDSSDATVMLSSDPAGYRMQVTFGINLVVASFTTWMQGPAGSFQGLALAPQASALLAPRAPAIQQH